MRLKNRVRTLSDHWIGIIGAVLFWCLLWGSFSPLTLLGGLLAAILVHVLFPLPPVGRELALRPLHALVFVFVFLKDLAVSSAQVSWYALRPSGSPGSSVVAVQLRSRSDLFLTFTGVLATLIPGSVVVEAQRSTGTLFFHTIGVTTQEEADDMRQVILAQEVRALKAFASREILADAGLVKGSRGPYMSEEGR